MLWMTLLACSGGNGASAPDPASSETLVPAAASRASGPYFVKRSDGELAVELRSACERAATRDAPVLLTFSASWCGDCQQLRKLAEESVLSNELARWEKVVVDVGRFDRHQGLLKHFGVESIAYQVALRPTSCEESVTKWPVLSSGAFEVATNTTGPRTASDVATWLEKAR